MLSEKSTTPDDIIQLYISNEYVLSPQLINMQIIFQVETVFARLTVMTHQVVVSE